MTHVPPRPLTAAEEHRVRSLLPKMSYHAMPRRDAERLLATLDEARAQRDRATAQAELAVERLTQADEANAVLLAILDRVASRLSAEEAATVAREAAKAVRR